MDKETFISSLRLASVMLAAFAIVAMMALVWFSR
jgi:hypothetical protein